MLKYLVDSWSMDETNYFTDQCDTLILFIYVLKSIWKTKIIRNKFLNSKVWIFHKKTYQFQ